MADQERQGKMGGVVPNDRTLRNTFGLFSDKRRKKAEPSFKELCSQNTTNMLKTSVHRKKIPRFTLTKNDDIL